MLHIGDEVYIHGYVDEIRNDMIIIHNKGGYFATVPDEIRPATPADFWAYDVERQIYYCPLCGFQTKYLLIEYEHTCPKCRATLGILRSDKKGDGNNVED